MRLAPLLVLLAHFAAPLSAQSKGTATAAPAADPYVGSFTGDGGSITVRKQGSTYSGTIIADGAEYPYTARKLGRSLVGTFQAQGQGYLFSAAVQGDQLTFVANRQTTVLQRGSGSTANRRREETLGDGRRRKETGGDARRREET